MKQLLINGRIFDGEQVLHEHAVLIEGHTIRAVPGPGEVPADADRTVDLKGHLLAPGFVDLQVNGGGGVLFNDAPSVETIASIASAHRQFGTTTLLPTLISDDMDAIELGANSVRQAMQSGIAAVKGIHIEGPFLNPAYCGVHDVAKLREPDAEALAQVASYANMPTLLTLAPEIAGMESIATLREAGITVFAGHSAASYEETRRAIEVGLQGFTHLFNAMTPWTSRAPGMVGAALESDNSFVGVIADGFHIHPATLRLTIAGKRTGTVLLVTDAMPTVGATQTQFKLGGVQVTAREGRCLTPDGRLAGSDIGMNEAVRNACQFGGVEREEALRMASCYPARAMGLDQQIGYIRPNYSADLIELDDDFAVYRSWISGEFLSYQGV